MTKEELLQSLEGIHEPIPVRQGLDDGLLVISADRLSFIGQRMGKWSVLEEWSRAELRDVKVSESFLGSEMTFQSASGRAAFKKIPSDVDIAAMLRGDVPRNATPSKVVPPDSSIPSSKENDEVELDLAFEDDDLLKDDDDFLEEEISLPEIEQKPIFADVEAEVKPREEFKSLKERMAERKQARKEMMNRQVTPLDKSFDMPEENPAGKMFGKLFTYIFFFMICSGFIGDC